MPPTPPFLSVYYNGTQKYISTPHTKLFTIYYWNIIIVRVMIQIPQKHYLLASHQIKDSNNILPVQVKKGIMPEYLFLYPLTLDSRCLLLFHALRLLNGCLSQCSIKTFVSKVGVWWCLTDLGWHMTHTHKIPSKFWHPWRCSL